MVDYHVVTPSILEKLIYRGIRSIFKEEKVVCRFSGKSRLLVDKPVRYSVAGKPALPIRCGVFHTRLMIGCPQWQATQGSSFFGGWQANLAKHVAVSATLTFATPQAAYANPLRSANFYIILNN